MSLTTPDRSIENLNPDFQVKVRMFLEKTKDLGVFITEGYRSQERQVYLYGQGRQRPWPIITWTLTSQHTEGKAIDIAFNWAVLYPENHQIWRNVADIARSCGIDWGYDLWGKDKPHFQDNGILMNNTEVEERKKVEERNRFYMSKLGISDRGLYEPITKWDMITINSLEFENITNKLKDIERRIKKLERK